MPILKPTLSIILSRVELLLVIIPVFSQAGLKLHNVKHMLGTGYLKRSIYYGTNV